MTLGVPLRGAWHEAMANVLATPWRFAVVMGVLAATLCWPAYREAILVHSLQIVKHRRAVEGAFISVATSQGTRLGTAGDGEGSGIPGPRCDALNAIPGIAAAGAIVSAGSVVPRAAPNGSIPLWRVSPGAAQLVAFTPVHAGVLMGSAGADELGVRSGARVSFRSSVLTGTPVVAVYPALGARTAALDRAVLLVEPSSTLVGSCLVELRGVLPNSAAEFLGTLLSGMAVDVRPLIVPGALSAEPSRTYREQAVRPFAVVAPLLSSLVWMLLLRVRRGEFVLARIFGASRIMSILQIVMEFSVCLAVAWVPAVAAVAAGSWGDRVAAAAGTACLVDGAAAALLVAVLAAVAMSVRRGQELRSLRDAE